ncbi:MAG: hypothetical protein P8Z75_10035 [Gammaproteobacteria bacterium]|jgi:hypothetical protein
MYKRFLALILIFTSSTAFAGTAIGHVTSIIVANNQDTVLFKVNTGIHNTPKCNETGQFAIHLDKPGGMATYMALLTAKQKGFTIMADGTRGCSGNWKSEDLRTLRLN